MKTFIQFTEGYLNKLSLSSDDRATLTRLWTLHAKLLNHRARLANASKSAESNYQSMLDDLYDGIASYLKKHPATEEDEADFVQHHMKKAYEHRLIPPDSHTDLKAIAADHTLNDLHYVLSAICPRNVPGYKMV